MGECCSRFKDHSHSSGGWSRNTCSHQSRHSDKMKYDIESPSFKNIYKPTAGAIVGRTPFLLFVGTWNTELKDSKD